MNYQYEHSIDESSNRQARQMSDFSLEFPQLSDSLAGPEVHRQERDGGAHVHGHGGGGRSGVRNQRQHQEERGERQAGGTGVAPGGLSNPPTEDGSYNFNFSNDDGTSRQESGAPSSVSGSYSFITPEGQLVEMQYTADELGFHASGSHMPTTPPPPPHVQRLLDHLAKVNGF